MRDPGERERKSSSLLFSDFHPKLRTSATTRSSHPLTHSTNAIALSVSLPTPARLALNSLKNESCRRLLLVRSFLRANGFPVYGVYHRKCKTRSCSRVCMCQRDEYVRCVFGARSAANDADSKAVVIPVTGFHEFLLMFVYVFLPKKESPNRLPVYGCVG